MKQLTIFSLLLLLIGCGGPQIDKPTLAPSQSYTWAQLDSLGRSFTPEIGTYGGVVNLAIAADPDGFCPALTNSGYSLTVLSFVFEGLITTDPATLEFKPHIAEKWEVTEDGLTWTFHLRQDVLFSDSVQLTSEDVLFTFNDIIYNDDLNSPLNHNFRVDGEKIKITAPDSFTVQFQLPKPFAPFLTIVGVKIMPKHAYAKVAADGTLQSYLGSAANPDRVIGSGPFTISDITMGQRITLTKNPLYWKRDAEDNRLPYLSKVQLQIIKEPNQQLQKFTAGEIDHIMLEAEHFPLLKPQEKQGNFTLYRVGPRWYERFFTFNQNNQVDQKGNAFLPQPKQSWFRSKEFRQACAYAVNYQDLINNIYNGLAYMPSGVWGKHKGYFHNPEARLYDFNPQKADSLLASLGLIDRNGDGIREDSLGNKVTFSLTTTAGVQKLQKIYEQVRKDLQNIGLEVHMDYVEFNTMIARTSSTFDWDACGFSLGGVQDPHFSKSSVVPSSFRYTINPQRETEEGTLIPKEDRPWETRIEEIFELAVQEMDSSKRKALYGEWQAIEQEQCPMIYLPTKEVILGAHNRFGNIQLTGTLNSLESLLHNIDEIFIRENN